MFTYIAEQGTRSIPITYHQFLSRIRSLLSTLGFNPSDYGSHFFRRGGASLAHSACIPTEHIKALGDWHSDFVFYIFIHPGLSVCLPRGNWSLTWLATHIPTNTSLRVPLWGLGLIVFNNMHCLYLLFLHTYCIFVLFMFCTLFWQYHSLDHTHLFLCLSFSFNGSLQIKRRLYIVNFEVIFWAIIVFWVASNKIANLKVDYSGNLSVIKLLKRLPAETVRAVFW